MVDPSQSLAFPMNVVALLPYMLLNYEDANELCIRSAENIAQVSFRDCYKVSGCGSTSMWLVIKFILLIEVLTCLQI